MHVTFAPDINPEKTNKVLDLRESTNHPLSLLYSEIYDAVVVNAMLKHGRSQPGFSIKGNSPFHLSAKAAVEYGLHKEDCVKQIKEVFQNYYDSVTPENAAKWLGINFEEGHQFYSQPPWGAVFPWRARSIVSYRMTYERAAIDENKAIGYDGKGIEEGWLFCGPVSEEKIQIESERMAFVLKSIHEKGYQRSNENDGDAKATALVRKSGEWRWILTAGNHRASAASALGFKQIPIRINLVVNRSQAEYWPHVVDGTFKKNEALTYFDMVFKGETPPITKSWNKNI